MLIRVQRFGASAVRLLALMGALVLGGDNVAARAPQVTDAAAADAAGAALVAKIEAEFDDPRFANAFWGVLIQSLDTGAVWYERNADKLFMPASNNKIATTASALINLGPDFKFETRLQHTGTIEEGVLKGDLVVWGNGDPTLYERFFKDTRDVFREFAAELKSRGIKRVDGRVIGDDDAWIDNHFNTGWPYNNIYAWYGAPYGPLQINEGYVDFKIAPPASIDGPVEITGNIPSSYYTIVNKVRVVAEGGNNIDINRPFDSNVFEFTGTVAPGGRTTEESPSITDPTKFYITVLRETLIAEGIEVAGDAVDCDDIDGWQSLAPDASVLATHYSAPLPEILSGLMKRSQNLYAETMLMTMGWKDSGTGSERAGRGVVERTLEQMGIAPGSYEYSDGSGLSRYDYIAPRQVVKILTAMRRNDALWQMWYDFLPIAGVDGTLRSRMKGTKAEKNVHAKTGTISNVRGLSGYVTTADGEELVFSFLVNGHTQSSAATEDVTDGALALIAAFNRMPAAPAQ